MCIGDTCTNNNVEENIAITPSLWRLHRVRFVKNVATLSNPSKSTFLKWKEERYS